MFWKGKFANMIDAVSITYSLTYHLRLHNNGGPPLDLGSSTDKTPVSSHFTALIKQQRRRQSNPHYWRRWIKSAALLHCARTTPNTRISDSKAALFLSLLLNLYLSLARLLLAPVVVQKHLCQASATKAIGRSFQSTSNDRLVHTEQLPIKSRKTN